MAETDSSLAQARTGDEPFLGELVGRLSEDTTRLVRDEMRLVVRELQVNRSGARADEKATGERTGS